MRAPLLLVVALGACGTFEDPDIVIDLRVLAMKAEPPEQVVDVDLMNPQQPAELLQQLGPTQVCALVADPGHDPDLRLHWEMRMCKLGMDDRCEDEAKSVFLGDGFISDPDTSLPQSPCVMIQPDGNLLGVLLDVLDGDPLGGLGGVDYGVVMRIGSEEASPALDVYATKTVRVSPRIPAERTANHNPPITTTFDFDVFGPLKLGHCATSAAPLQSMLVNPGQDIQLNPDEPPGARETYVVPTLDGKTRELTESLTYQWTATDGNFTAGTTGGPRDPFGNPAVVYTDWIAPNVSRPTRVSVWVVQRDERLGVQWYETCIDVAP